MTEDTDRKEELDRIHEDILGMADSPLVSYRLENGYLPVPGEGSPFADIVFIGEAPGKNEAKTGRPFTGRAGDILNELLASAGIKREDIFITNIVKDRPPKNRDPKEEEIEAYGHFLDRQIDVIQPKVIATLGRFSMEYVMRRFGLESELLPIGDLHGKALTALAPHGEIKIVVLYHPCVAIYNCHKKPILLEDFKVLQKVHKKLAKGNP